MRPAIMSSSSRPLPVPSSERFGPYVVLERIGIGGMASVHRAERLDITGRRKQVALKRLRLELSDDLEFVEAFMQEGRIAKLLRHRHIVAAYESGKLDDTHYIAMELVKGPTLQTLMTQCRTAAGAIPVRVAVEILIQLCEALHHVHTACDEHGTPLGLIHRDVSPANVIIASSGLVKLIDFGVVKARQSRVRTQVGCIKGKLSYVAPEYTHGRLDARADLFAVGVIAHELLTGHRLFEARTDTSVVAKVRALPIAPPSRQEPSVSRDLDDIVITALQRNPALRWQNAQALGVALGGVARDLGGRLSSRELIQWVEWAFSRQPWGENTVAGVIDDLVVSERSDRIARGTGCNDALPAPPTRQAVPRVDTDPTAIAKRPSRPAREPEARPSRARTLTMPPPITTARTAGWQLPPTGRQLPPPLPPAALAAAVAPGRPKVVLQRRFAGVTAHDSTERVERQPRRALLVLLVMLVITCGLAVLVVTGELERWISIARQHVEL